VRIRGPVSQVRKITDVFALVQLEGERNNLEQSLSVVPRAEEELVSSSDLVIEPETVDVTVPIQTREGFRTVAILPNIQGRPPTGYTWQVEYTPETITVTGAQLRLDSMTVPVLTDAIDLSSQTESFERTVGVILPPLIAPATEQTITVSITIEAIESFHQFSDIPVESQGLPPAYRATIVPDTVTVVVTGPRPIINSINTTDVRAIVDLIDLAPDTYTLAPQIVIVQEGVPQDGISVLPAVVEVQIIDTQATPTVAPTSMSAPSDGPTPEGSPTAAP
jgi:YbbR domain-containing protein